MAKARLKLFVWTDFCPDYRGGLAFAIARDEAEARKMVEAKHGYAPYNWGNMTTHRIDRRVAYSVSGGG